MLGILWPHEGKAISRIKDIVNVESIRSNQLVGYGLVVGLNGSGDTLNKSPFTKASLTGMLERMGINTRNTTMETKNTAAVIVTASLPPFARKGSHIDVEIASLGDAKSLLGGTLLVTPLMGADGEVYAVGQGSVSTSGFTAASSKGTGNSVTKGVPTNGSIPSGAIVEKEIGYEFNKIRQINLTLRNPDFTTSQRIANTINKYAHVSAAKALDPATVCLSVPVQYYENVVPFMTQIESLKIEPDQPAQVVIDDRNGVIVMGENVRINTVAVSHGSLLVRVIETPTVSQPGTLSGGTTQTNSQTSIHVNDGDGKRMAIVHQNASLRELVDGLNALGTSPRDTISILGSIKAAGALQAEVKSV